MFQSLDLKIPKDWLGKHGGGVSSSTTPEPQDPANQKLPSLLTNTRLANQKLLRHLHGGVTPT